MTDRRTFLADLSRLSLAAALTPDVARWRVPRFAATPFTLGVASGDPTERGVVLWTRLAPDPLNGGGMPNESVRVRWELAEDDRFARVVQRGTAVAMPEWAHAVHVEVSGLHPGRWYWYRFTAGSEISPVGRTRTMPAARVAPDRMRFAFASCQHYEAGYYGAYAHMAGEELDFVAHLGDYIYESDTTPALRVRPHGSPEPKTLDAYRNRYALYKLDPDLQAAHAAFPWIVTWDDHEVANNYAGLVSADNEPVERFRLRRAAAYRAYYEHQPLRRASIPKGPDALLYRRLAFGSLGTLHVLDTRQYRSDQACGDGRKAPCAEWGEDGRTMMGELQERWLQRNLASSSAAWNVLAQQVMMAKFDLLAGSGEMYPMDMWSGYPAARDRLTRFIDERRVRNVVVLTGDIHSNWANDVLRDFRDDRSPAVATEFVGTSISSAGDGSEVWPAFVPLAGDNPWIKFQNNRRGYVRCEVTRDLWRTDYRVLPYVSKRDAPISTAATFVTQAGRPGVEKA